MARFAMRIPDQAIAGFEKLLKLSDSEVNELDAAIQKTPATLSPTDFERRVAGQTSLAPLDIRDLIEVLLNLYLVRADTELPIEDFVKVVLEAMESTEAEELVPEDGDWTSFRSRLSRLLQYEESIGVVAKASFLGLQHSHVYHEARLFTDFRPIFRMNAEERPLAGLISHTLKIEYHQDGRINEFFVALDQDDVRELRRLLNRADIKAKSLKAALENANMPIIGVQDDDNRTD
jgi:hypothetical protein